MPPVLLVFESVSRDIVLSCRFRREPTDERAIEETDEHLHQRIASRRGEEIVQSPFIAQMSLVEQAEPVAEPLRFVEMMRADDDRLSRSRKYAMYSNTTWLPMTSRPRVGSSISMTGGS